VAAEAHTPCGLPRACRQLLAAAHEAAEAHTSGPGPEAVHDCSWASGLWQVQNPQARQQAVPRTVLQSETANGHVA
jgi:hypothetical protein